MEEHQQKKFPDYFENFVMPENAGEYTLTVYRACVTRKVEKESFLSTYEENGYKVSDGKEKNDPGEYSLSTYESPKDVKRFNIIRPNRPRCEIAIGTTVAKHGICLRDKDYIPEKKKSSHVHWWLYEGAEPHKEFRLIENFEEYFEKWKSERAKKRELEKGIEI